ncbi:Mrm1p Ecym_8294 [Eremothecium cymbalariae DBVPG|uniref:rRNA methyltransferase 1, mitochondrial n=1 Tax=Eremothecium cymbalariae (strain CBS 270.75 / DBVPG 7215 / KCTC 17166 / NRRL Y-17582) TaxID=931890 RepID=G8JXJ9_ERECY|nr:Hypothetical protein Ecym_8294 [Eremothecium cymbalariae DBVPG\
MNRQYMRLFSSKVKSAVKVPNSSSFQNRAVNFRNNLPFHQRKKAWEKDGMAKDEWFRKKYAHIHARDGNSKSGDPYNKRASHVARLKQENEDQKRQHMEHKSKFQRDHAYRGLKPNPLLEYVYGTNSVLAAMQANKREYFTRLLHYGVLNPQIESLAKQLGVTMEEVDKHRLNIITNYGVHNNIVLEAKPLQPSELSHLGLCNPEEGNFEYTEMFLDQPTQKSSMFLSNGNKKFPLGLYLDEVVDPHNIGAILRSAYFLGADFVVLSRKNCAPLSPVTSKVSSGAMELIPIYNTDKPLNFFEKSKQYGGWTVLTTCVTTGTSVTQMVKSRAMLLGDLPALLQKTPVILVVGNEGNGVRTNIMQRSDFFVQVPFGRVGEIQSVDSLNVSVATSLLLHQLLQ